MKKWKKEYEFPRKTVEVQAEEDWQKRMAHGHYCPYCKAEILDVSTCLVTYLVPPTIHNIKRLSKKHFFNRANRRICCPDCRPFVLSLVEDPLAREAHILGLIATVGSSNGRVKELKLKKGDTYKDVVLKMNGFDPSVKTSYTIFPVDDKIGEATGLHAMVLRTIHKDRMNEPTICNVDA